jgi:WAS family protein 1
MCACVPVCCVLLWQVVHEVFGRIEDKVATNRDKLIEVNNRINVAKAKVDGIVGSTKATQVFSSAKYPGPESLSPFVPVYQGVQRHDIERRFHPEIDTRIGKGTDEDTDNKLQFFSIDFHAKYGLPSSVFLFVPCHGVTAGD